MGKVNILFSAVFCFVLIDSAVAAPLYWDGDGSGTVGGGDGTWDTTLSRWCTTPGGNTYQAWLNADYNDAVFQNTAGTVTISGGVTASNLIFNTAGYVLTNSAVTLFGVRPMVSNDVAATISSAVNCTGVFFKAGVDALTLGANNPISGGIIIDSGSLKYTTDQMTTAGGLTFVSTMGSTNIGTLDLSAANLSVTNLIVQNNNSSTNAITIGSGKTLTINGPVVIGGSGTTNITKLAVGGATGQLSIGAGNFSAWNYNGTANLNLSGLGTFNFNTGAGAYNFNIAFSNGASVLGSSTVTLAQTNVLRGSTLMIGYGGGTANTGKLLTPTNSATTLGFDTIYVGRFWNNGSLFALGTNSILTLDSSGPGGHAADCNVGYFDSTQNGAASSSSSVDFSPGTVYANIRALMIGYGGNRGGGGGPIVSLTFGTNGVGGTMTIGTVDIARGHGGTFTGGNEQGTFNIQGGSVTVTGAYFRIGIYDAGSTCPNLTGTLNIRGGSLTVSNTDITTAPNGSYSTNTISVSGGTLDLRGHAIGSASSSFSHRDEYRRD